MAKNEKQRGAEKTVRLPIHVTKTAPLPKPSWIRARGASASGRFDEVQSLLRQQHLATVCEEAGCPNRGECFGKGTAAFMILGDTCTRRCPFCDVAHGRPALPDAEEPRKLAQAVARLGLAYVVITSVTRDDLADGGAGHYAACIREIRRQAPAVRIEILTPDFRGKESIALDKLGQALPDVMNHNLETVPRLYRLVRPGADYARSLALLRAFRARYPSVPTKSGLMVGLGETDQEILDVMQDLRHHGVEMLTVGQYLAPSPYHLPVARYVHPDTFRLFGKEACRMGFAHAVAAPLVRSSYHADRQAREAGVI
ncbi:MAG: lipoyl synthase [Oxalobacter formigenes]|nr:lipoyl synthase [Oxalobacter formigenes]